MPFPALTQLSEPNTATILASGAGSVLDLTNLTSLSGATGFSTFNINAQAGGKVDLSKVTGQTSGRIYAHADGTNSVIDFSKLPALISDAISDSGLEAGNGGSILTGALTTLNRGDLQLDDNTSSIITSQITTITTSNLAVYGGGDLAFPALTQLSEANTTTILASGAGSVLDLTNLTSLSGATGFSTFNINAQAGGKVDLSKVTKQTSGRIVAQADGANSVIDFSKLPVFFSDAVSNSALVASNSGQVIVPSGTIELTRVDVIAMTAGRISGGTLQLFPGSTLSGDSLIQANVVSAATTNPGNNGIGVLTIGGNFTQFGAGTLDVQIGGTDSGSQYDQLAVTGATQLSGSLTITLSNGFSPAVGNTFSIITYAARAGEFAVVQWIELRCWKNLSDELWRK